MFNLVRALINNSGITWRGLRLLAGLGAAGGVILASLVVWLGLVNVAAIPPHWGVTTDILHTVFKRSVAMRATTPPPADLASEGRWELGAQHYANVCAKCHGGPGLGQDPIALSMRPTPQALSHVVGQFSDSELFWIVQNGVRFSAMPAWPVDARDDEIWSMVAFLRKLPEMTADDYLTLTAPKLDAGPAIAQTPVGEERAAHRRPVSDPVDEYAPSAPSTEWAGIAASGQPIAACARCHGVDGSGAATGGEAPNLTGLGATYIADSLRAYQSGTRKSGIMQVAATGLSSGQIDALAQHYASLPRISAAPIASTAPPQIALVGKPEHAVPGCLLCHEATSFAPSLSGQQPVYIERQLAAFAANARGSNGIYNPMPWIAKHLTTQDMKELAAYFASRDPAQPIPVTPAPADAAKRASALVGGVCKTCHEESLQGTASGEFPNLTLQTADYVRQSLEAYRLKDRVNSKMNQTAERLSNAEIADLAAYIGALPPAPLQGAGADAALAAKGADLALKGEAARGLPACVSCHGAAGVKGLPLAPRLNGQNATYLKNRLNYLATRAPGELYAMNPMRRIAESLTEAQRAEVAAWFATQPVLPK